MTEIPVGELNGFDIGRRVILTHEGAAITGTIENFNWINYTTSRGVEIHSLTVATGGTSSFRLQSLPLDYRIQIDRPEGDS
jgi:hypothetical protein